MHHKHGHGAPFLLAPGEPADELFVYISGEVYTARKNYRFPVAAGSAYFFTIARIAGKFSSEQ